MSSRNITLLIPGLLGPDNVKCTPGALDGLELDALALMFSRGQASASEHDFISSLFGLFDIRRELSHDWPVAQLTALIDFPKDRAGLPSCLYRADPVHLKADRDRVVMFGNRHLNVTLDEAQQLAQEFNQLFGDDGVELITPTATHWYLAIDQRPQISTTELSRTIGQDIHPLLPKGEHGLYWHRLLNEAQMLFHSSGVNQRREAQGLETINSVWLWGGGQLPEPKALSWQGVWSNEMLAGALANYQSIETGSAPACAEDWLEQVDSGNHLVVLDGVADVVQFDDIGRWRDFIEGVSQEWIAPLFAALKNGSVAQLTLETAQGQCFSLTAKQLRRWWRRAKPISTFLR